MFEETLEEKKDAPVILVVEDEASIRDVVRRYLQREGFQVKEARDGYEALDALGEDTPDLIVLDLMLPGVDGLTITQHIQKRGRIPIIILTAKGETSDRIRGLDMGADDYVVKPFNPRELISRVQAVLRRTGVIQNGEDRSVRFGQWELDPVSRTLNGKDGAVTLTATEFDLLWFFAKHPRQVFSRDRILEHVWGENFSGDPSTVTVHVRRLREKIEPDPSSPQHLITVWGVGYRFEAT